MLEEHRMQNFYNWIQLEHVKNWKIVSKPVQGVTLSTSKVIDITNSFTIGYQSKHIYLSLNRLDFLVMALSGGNDISVRPLPQFEGEIK